MKKYLYVTFAAILISASAYGGGGMLMQIGGGVAAVGGGYPSETALYRFESGALVTDSSGNGYTLTANGDAASNGTYYVEGLYSVFLDSSGDTMTSSNVIFDIGADQNFTFSFWFRIPAASRKLVSKSVSFTNGYEIGTRYVDPNYPFYARFMASGASLTTITTAWVPSAATWYHVVLIYDTTAENEVTIYASADGGTFGDQINGTQYNCDTDPAASATDFTIGESGLNGYIDDVRFLRQTINASQAEDLFDGTWVP